MKRNELFKLKIFIPCRDEDYMDKATGHLLNNIDKVYSYKVLMRLEEGQHTGWDIEFLISQTDSFNTIDKTDAVIEIVNIILEHRQNDVTAVLIGFKQPPLELMLQLYEPLVSKLATEQHLNWPIEYDDLCQMCRLAIITLHNKGYFIHKSLIRTTFVRDVLLAMRVKRKEPEQVSYNNLCKSEKEYIAYIEDESVQDEFDCIISPPEEELEDKKQLIQKEVGTRVYDQLVREYGTKTTTAHTRKLVNKLKNKLGEVK